MSAARLARMPSRSSLRDIPPDVDTGLTGTEVRLTWGNRESHADRAGVAALTAQPSQSVTVSVYSFEKC